MTFLFGFEFFTSFFLILICSAIFHEWGHVQYFKSLGRKVNVSFKKGILEVGKPKDYKGLSKKQLKQLYFAGIWMGLIPIILGSLFFHTIYLLILIPYIAGIQSDLKNYWRHC